VKVEAAGASAVVVSDVSPRPFVGGGVRFEVGGVGDEVAFDLSEVFFFEG